MICLWMGKNLMAKTLPGDFQVTTPETPLLSQQAVTSKGISSTLPTYSWTLTAIPNWTCSVVTVPISDAWLPSTWLTNCTDPSTPIWSCVVLHNSHYRWLVEFGHWLIYWVGVLLKILSFFFFFSSFVEVFGFGIS